MREGVLINPLGIGPDMEHGDLKKPAERQQPSVQVSTHEGGKKRNKGGLLGEGEGEVSCSKVADIDLREEAAAAKLARQ